MSDITVLASGQSNVTLDDGKETTAINVNQVEGTVKVLASGQSIVTMADGKETTAKNVVLFGNVSAGQVKTMPEANKFNEGQIVQYVGETTTTYHKGYFYESYQDGTAPSVATIEQTVGEGLEDLAVDKDTFETQITEAGTYDFIARLNREHIIATVSETSVRMDRDESHDVEGAVAWTPDGETYFYTEELVPDVGDDVFADPDGAEVAGAVSEYAAEDIGWEFDGEFVDLEDYGISYTPADPEATVAYSSEALETVTVDADTFATQVAESDLYIFDAVVMPERILATVGEEMIQYNRSADNDTETLFGWMDENTNVVYTDSATPSATDEIYSDTEGTVAGTVDAYQAGSTTWYRGAEVVDLTDYGIAYTGTAEDGNTIHIQYVSEPPHQDDVIEVTYAESYPTYDWRRINVQPAEGGAEGTVDSVNNIDPVDGNITLTGDDIDATVGETEKSIEGHLQDLADGLDALDVAVVKKVNDVEPVNGAVVIDGGDIKATVGGTEDTIENQLESLRNDLGDLADDLDLKITNPSGGTAGQVLKKTATGEEWGSVSITTKVEVAVTGESGTLTAEQIAAITDDSLVSDIVCDGQVFYLANKMSSLTYRTYINTDCALESGVVLSAIYVQLNSGAANYGSWSKESIVVGNGFDETKTQVLKNVQGVLTWVDEE